MSIFDDLTTWSPRGAAVSLWALGAAFLAWLLFGAGAESVAGVWLAGMLALVPGSVLVWRATGAAGSWRRFVREHLDWHLLAASLLFVLAAEHAFHWQITSDGGLYFANLRSIVFDHDLQIRPELAVLDLSDRPHSIVPVGPSVVWAPLYLLVAAVDWLVGPSPTAGAAHGLQGAYVRAALVSSWLCAAIGVVVIHWRLRREFGRGPSLLTSLLMLGATPLAYYLVVEPSMPHAASFGAVALALTVGDAWCRRGLPSGRQAWIIGSLIGLAFLIRPQDALFGIFPLVAIAAAGAPRASRRHALTRLAWLFAGLAPFLLAQAAFAWAVMRANPVPYQLVGGGGYLDLTSPRWLDVLFSARHGLLSWTPVVTVALVGTVVYARRERTWALPALIVFGAMCWINGSTTDWWGGAAFGGRRFTSMLGALAPGLAVIVVALLRRPLLILAPVAGGFVFWNYLLMMQFETGLMSRDEAIGFDRLIKQQAEVYVRPPYFYPFAFPANAWFAWRHGVSIDRYDLLAPEPMRVHVDVPFDASGARFLVQGWSSTDDDQFGARYFLDGDAGTMVVPLDVAAHQRYGIEVRARAGRAQDAGPVVLAIDVNGRYLGRFTLALGADPITARFAVQTDEHSRPWRKGYNRVTFRRVRSAALQTEAGSEPAVAVYMVRFGPDLLAPDEH
jgi:hypothetical protein